MLTKNAVSPSVGLASVMTSLTVFVAAYLSLAIADAALVIRDARKDAEPEPAAGDVLTSQRLNDHPGPASRPTAIDPY